MDGLEERIQLRGLELFQGIEGKKPSIFNPRTLTGALMSWSMGNEQLKTQLFRLVDVLPALRSSREVAEHVREYLGNGEAEIPRWMRWAAAAAGWISPVTALASRKMVHQIAQQFILAPNETLALPQLRRLRDSTLTFTADLLGEVVVSEREAERFEKSYERLIRVLARAAAAWPEVPQVDLGPNGQIPKVNVSIKLSSLYSQLKPVDPAGGIAALEKRVLPLLLLAVERGAFINFDMESTVYKEITIELFQKLLSEPRLQNYRHFGLALQAYLKSSEDDLRSLLAWVQKRGTPITIRLIKGAYWDYEQALAIQRNWPVPVFEHKHQTDARFERLAQLMLENRNWIDCAFGTHNLRSIAACIGQAEELGLPQNAYEFQMLYGMAEPIKQLLVQKGYRVREYTAIGEILPGMSYLVRRLLENSSNEGFLRASFGEGATPELLLKKPELNETQGELSHHSSGFRNEPLTDWTLPFNREKMSDAIAKVRPSLGRTIPLIINGRSIEPPELFTSRNPARAAEVVGRVASAGIREVELAIDVARKTFPAWSRASVDHRAGLLEKLAALIGNERFQLAALEMFETGKNWTESDADIAEAIDFCRYYALEMRRLAQSHSNLPGEENEHTYLPRGIAVIIAPWNFPLAILCGMTAAALVAGNCVLMKPAEESSVVAARFAELLAQAGFPRGSFAFLPGRGEIIGQHMVAHPQVQMIAFTGSKEVGLNIWKTAGVTDPGQEHLKKVVCEMGGKNAVIVDADADLDEAIPALLYSAFGYGGQKCSALSLLIVVEDAYELLLHRLCEAARNLVIGYPEDPATIIGPLISEEAMVRVRNYVLAGKTEAILAFEGTVPAHLNGYFVPPVIFRDVPPDSRIAQEEIFGPVLSVIRAATFAEALDLANRSQYALTGGLFSRNPAHIKLARREFQVGNLYINRGITGALVARQPFGGFKMSGGGTKAGGSDYLLNFLYPRTITENTMRRGFAPVASKTGE